MASEPLPSVQSEAAIKHSERIRAIAVDLLDKAVDDASIDRAARLLKVAFTSGKGHQRRNSDHRNDQ